MVSVAERGVSNNLTAKPTNPPNFAQVLYSNEALQGLRELALEQILSLIVRREDGTALVRAGEGRANPQYRNAWFRDVLRVVMGLEALPRDFSSKNLGLKTGGHLDLAAKLMMGVFEGLRLYEQRIDAILKEPTLYSNSFCVPPRVVPETLAEVPGEWSNTQEPQWMGELLHFSAPWLSTATGNRASFAQAYLHLYRKAAQYLIAIKCFDNAFANAWEEGRDVYTSNIAASLAGLIAAKRLGAPVEGEVINHGRKKLEERLSPLRETDLRHLDLALLFVSRYGVIPVTKMDEIVAEVRNGLGSINGTPRITGIPRYLGDSYQGLDGLPGTNWHTDTAGEGEWPIGRTQLAMHFARKYGALEDFARELQTAVKLMRTYGGKAYEQFVPIYVNGDRTYDPNNLAFIPRNPLAWAAAELLVVLK